MKFTELEYSERREIAELFSCWLKPYTHKVILKVIAKTDEIINNAFVMSMLRELKSREEAEAEDFANSISDLMEDLKAFAKYDPHNQPLTHSTSYRDILWDMYIK